MIYNTFRSLYTALCQKYMPNTPNLQHLSVNLLGSVLQLDDEYSYFATPLGQFAWTHDLQLPSVDLCSSVLSMDAQNT